MTLEILANPITGYIPLTVSFSCLTELFPTQYVWEFGDGETSNAEAPTHTYEAAGTYTVKLRVTDANAETELAETSITVDTPAAPSVSISTDITQAYAPAEIPFNSEISGGIPVDYELLWDFGDGETSNAEAPTHTYEAAGTYTVTLTVTNNGGNITTTARLSVIISAAQAPTANIIPLTYDGRYAPLTVKLAAEVTGGIPEDYVYEWDINGTKYDTEIVTHTLEAAGTYTVTLAVSNNRGHLTTDAAEWTCTLLEPESAAVEISTDTTEAYAPQTVNFSSIVTRSDGETDGYLWEFGDGETSTEENPSHKYTSPGTYAVTLTVTTCEGKAQTKTTPLLLTILEATYPVLNLTATQTGQYTAEIRNDTEYPDIQPTRVVWNFGDGSTEISDDEEGQRRQTHTYNTTGIYTVTVTNHYENGYFHSKKIFAVILMANATVSGIQHGGNQKRRRR